MEVILGTAQLTQFRKRLSKKKIGYFLRSLADMGDLRIDTAPLYSSLDSERIIGEWLPEVDYPNIGISTKFGLNFSNLPFPLNRFHQKITLNKKNLDGFTWPIDLERELLGSLSRLQRSKLDTFFMHQLQNVNFRSSSFSILEDLKKRNLINNIGISFTEVLNSSLKGIDVIQIPYHKLNAVSILYTGKIEIHSFFKDYPNSTTFAARIEKARKDSRISGIVFGTSNLEHFTENRRLIRELN